VKRALFGLLTIGVVASIASVCAIALSTDGEAGTTQIADIAGSPSEWAEQEVTVEGWVGATFDHQFVLWDDGVTSTIMVECAGNMPTGGAANRVSVTGTVGIDRFSSEQAYVLARSWEYQN